MTLVHDSRPLKGVRVLDLATGAMAAIGKLLADFGADVIRVEPSEGSEDRKKGVCAAGVSLNFVAANLGKRAASDDQYGDLLAGADILIANASTDIASATAKYPSLVAMSVRDFGAIGKYAKWHGSGPVYHALSGELSRSGIPNREPLLPPGDLAESCAALQGAFVLLIAYYNRLRTGIGDSLDFSVLDGAAQALDPAYGISGSASQGVPASKMPRGRPEAGFMYPILRCKDGFVRICILAPRQWQGLFKWMGEPEEFADDRFNTMNHRYKSPTLLPAIAAFFADKTRSEIEVAGQGYGVPVAAVLDLDEALATPQVVARKAFRNVEIAPGVQLPMPDGLVEIDGSRAGFARPAPLLPAEKIGWQDDRLDIRFSAPGERALSGLRVLDFGVIVVGADTSRLLGDQGAEIIKVESTSFPDGVRQSRNAEAISANFVVGHRNKKSLGLDLRNPKARPVLNQLVAQSDVLFANFKGGTLQSLGLDYDTLKEINPQLVVVDSSAFGPTGPWSKRMGYGPLVRASSALTMQWRYPGEPDSFSDATTVYPDHAAARIGAISALALLIRKLRTGTGGSASISQAEIILNHMATDIAIHAFEADGGKAVGKPERSAVYECAGDDDWCVVTIRDEHDEQVIGQITQGRDLADWLAGQQSRDTMEVLQDAGIPAAAMLRVTELPAFDYYQIRKMFRDAFHPVRQEHHREENAPVRSRMLPDPPSEPAPLSGQHTVEIIKERLGLADREITDLLAAGALEQFQAPQPT